MIGLFLLIAMGALVVGTVAVANGIVTGARERAEARSRQDDQHRGFFVLPPHPTDEELKGR